jgi:putative ABC transport system permease protein
LTVIGVLDAKGQTTMGTDQDDLVLIPLRTFQRRIAGNQDVNIIQVSAAKDVSTDRGKRDIEHILCERRHLPPAGEGPRSVDFSRYPKVINKNCG